MTAPADFRPRRALAVDLATAEVDYPDPKHRPDHPRARVLVRWLEEPLGMVDLELPDDEVAAAATERAWSALRPQVVAAMQRYGLPAPASPAGIALRGNPPPASPTRTTGPLVTVTIASFRSPESTVHTVERVLECGYSPFEVVVVDNDRSPATLSAALAGSFGGDRRVRWVHEPRQGLSFARNAGLAAARGSIVVFTDDDVYVDRFWLARLVTAFEVADGVGCVTGAILPAVLETPAQAWLEEFGGFHKGFQRRVFNATTHRHDSPLYPYNAGLFGSGANMAFRTEVIRGLGGFAVDLGAGTAAHGGEDLDIFQRTVSAGHTVVYEPAALMWHLHRPSLAALRRQMFRYGVGLAATVTKWMLDDRRTAVAILRRLPAGAHYLLSPTSKKNQGKSSTFPPALTRLERAGVLCGPFAYVRSRRRVHRMAATAARPADETAATPPSLSFSVVICAYTEQRWDDVLAAVRSVQAQSAPPLEVILVVDHNPELLARLAAELPGVRVVANQQERGLSGGKNTGASLARGDVVAFLDDDAVADPDWLEHLGAAYTAPRVVGVGGRTLPRWATGRPRWFPEEFDWTIGCTYVGREPGRVRNLLGGNASFRREVFGTVAGFPVGIGRTAASSRPLGCEETEFCIRVSQQIPWAEFVYTPGAVIHHRVPEARERFAYFRSRCYAEGLSKALVTRSVGAADGLSTERTYTRTVLRRGIARDLGQAAAGDSAGLARAGAIVVGLAITAWGYGIGLARSRGHAPGIGIRAG